MGLGSGNGSNMGGPRKSADALRAELNQDASIRALQERVALAESGAGLRERELQMTIEKLRKENRTLAASAVRMSEGAFTGSAGYQSEQREVEVLRKTHAEEVRGLREKLAWYAENQQLLEAAEDVKVALRGAVEALKRELRKRGAPPAAISACLARANEGVYPPPPHGYGHGEETGEDGENNPLLDVSLTSNSTHRQTITTTSRHPGGALNKPKYARHPGDVKKIMELEATLADLQVGVVSSSEHINQPIPFHATHDTPTCTSNRAR